MSKPPDKIISSKEKLKNLPPGRYIAIGEAAEELLRQEMVQLARTDPNPKERR